MKLEIEKEKKTFVDDEVEIEKITDKKIDKDGKVYYFCFYKDYDFYGGLFEFEEDIKNKNLINLYEQELLKK